MEDQAGHCHLLHRPPKHLASRTHLTLPHHTTLPPRRIPFAQKSDLAKASLLKDSPNGIVVGKFGKDLVRLFGQQFVILPAPIRSGKGVCVVIPNLHEYQESVVALDIKRENFALTNGWRASQGHEVYLFNPFAEGRDTHRWNPLRYISPGPPFRTSDIQSIAAMLYPELVHESDTVDCNRMAMGLKAISALTRLGARCAAEAHARLTWERAGRV